LRKNGPRKPEMFYITFDSHRLNKARTQTLSVLPGRGPVSESVGPRPEDQARAVQTSTLYGSNYQLSMTGGIRYKFEGRDLLNLYKFLPKDGQNSVYFQSLIGSISICEQAFSLMKLEKPTQRNQIIGKNLSSVAVLVVTYRCRHTVPRNVGSHQQGYVTSEPR
jgi:hypothetical protein